MIQNERIVVWAGGRLGVVRWEKGDIKGRLSESGLVI